MNKQLIIQALYEIFTPYIRSIYTLEQELLRYYVLYVCDSKVLENTGIEGIASNNKNHRNQTLL